MKISESDYEAKKFKVRLFLLCNGKSWNKIVECDFLEMKDGYLYLKNNYKIIYVTHMNLVMEYSIDYAV